MTAEYLLHAIPVRKSSKIRSNEREHEGRKIIGIIEVKDLEEFNSLRKDANQPISSDLKPGKYLISVDIDPASPLVEAEFSIEMVLEYTFPLTITLEWIAGLETGIISEEAPIIGLNFLRLLLSENS